MIIGQHSIANANKDARLAVPVDYEARPLASAFTAGNPIVPRSVRNRVDRLNDYQKLFNGEFSDFLGQEDLRVRLNPFRKAAVWLADELLSRPPEIVVPEGYEQPTSPRFRESLLRSIHSLVVDYNRFGIGLLEVRQAGDGRWECTAPMPIYWHPLSDSSQAFVRRVQGADEDGNAIDIWEVTLDYGNGLQEVVFFANDGNDFGQPIESLQVQLGMAESWGVLAQASLGRTSPFITGGAPPGVWRLGAVLIR